MQALVRARGLTPYQALVAGTSIAAGYFGTLSEAGTVAVGERAELVLLKRNPLEEVKNAALLAGGMLGDRWILREGIGRPLSETKAADVASP